MKHYHHLPPQRLLWLLLTILLPIATLIWLSAMPQPAQSSEFGGRLFDRKVVRAYFGSPDKVAEVAQWRVPWGVNLREGYLELDVSPEELAQLEAWGFRVEVDEALTDLLYRPARPLANQPDNTIPGYPCYRTLVGTQTAAQNIVTSYPQLAELLDIGDSWAKTQNPNAGHDLTVLRLTNRAIPGPKPIIFMISAIHAREYTPAELNTRFAEYLVQNYGQNADATFLLDYYDFHLLLQANPDGRVQAQNGLLWRKNHNQNYCNGNFNQGFRPGIDLNRNFAYEWGAHGGSSGAACSDLFRGPSAGSEPETQAVQNHALNIFADQRDAGLGAAAPVTATGLFMDLHSYSELVLWPWGFPGQTGNATAFRTLGRKLAYFNGYTPIQAVNLYRTDGSTDDFIYGELGVAALTFELGTAFFQDCGTFDNTILPDNLPSLLYMSKAARAPYLLPAGPEVLNVRQSALLPTSTELALTAVLNDSRYSTENGIEPSQPISTAVVYLGAPTWITPSQPIAAFAPTDGSFNSPIENARALIDISQWDAGRHTLFVQAQDNLGNWGVETAIFVDIPPRPTSPITASFTSATTAYVGETVSFTNLSQGEILTHTWDFGDGSPLSYAPNPTHTYALTGTFTVSLTVANGVMSDTAVSLLTILPHPLMPPTASFTSTSPVYLGDPIQFTDLSQGQILTRTWDFGDGSPLSYAPNPTHTYALTGTFTVTLTVANGGGRDTAVAPIHILPPPPVTTTYYHWVPLVAYLSE
jgi:carboxypeptidase T